MMKLNNDYEELKKGAWSPEEDEKLIAYIKSHGIHIWSQMPKAAGLSRSGKSCRFRWMNYLRPDLKRGRLTMEERKTIIALHQSLGNKWSQIAAQLPGRTDNEIKNFWQTHMKKCYSKLVRGSANPCKAKIRTKLKQKNMAEEVNSLFNYVAEELYAESNSNIMESTQFPIAESYSPSKDDSIGNMVENNVSSFNESRGEMQEKLYPEPFWIEDDVCIPEMINSSTIFDEPGWACPAHDQSTPTSQGFTNDDELAMFWFDIFMEARRL